MGDVAHLQRVAQIGLVAAVLLHRVGVGYSRERHLCNSLAAAERFEDTMQYGLQRGKDVFLGDERHFHIKLIKLTRRTIGARILIPGHGAVPAQLLLPAPHAEGRQPGGIGPVSGLL